MMKFINKFFKQLSTIKIHFTAAAIFFFSSVSLFAQRTDAFSTITPPEVSIAGTQQLKYTSLIAGQEYSLYVSLPGNYHDTTKVFPVIYLIDAQWDFTLVYAIYDEQYFDGFIPAVVLVGITWGGTKPDYDSLRAYDFTPTDVSGKGLYGNASTFLKFIKKELIPFIESKYRVNKTERTLMGSSLGGLFTLYAFFNETELFNHYVLTSPVIEWDNGVLRKYEKDYAENRSHIPVKVFTGIGEYEDIQNFQQFSNHLKEQYKGPRMQAKILDGVGHSGSKALGFTKGLQYVFARHSLTLNKSILGQYIGEYQINPQTEIKIKIENDHLVAKMPNDRKFVLNAETDKDFYVIGRYAVIHFKKDDSGKILGFQLERYGGEMFVNKIN